MRFIKEMQESESILGHYLCKQKSLYKSRQNKSYYSLVLSDKTGVIEGKVWELSNHIQNFEENDFIKIEGTVQSYQNVLQLNIKKIRKSREGEYDPNDFMPITTCNIDEMFDIMLKHISSVENIHLRTLLENVFVNNSKIAFDFKKHSAAKHMHHNYVGGLLEHTLSVVTICDFFAGHFKGVNRDLLITCAMLHDIGKLWELSGFPSNDYTDEGQLLGHIFIGTEMLSAEMRNIDGFPIELMALVKHCILSHHGEYEFGSPKRPKILEAFIVHEADDLDAKVKLFETFIDEDNKSVSNNSKWTGYNKILGRYLRRT